MASRLILTLMLIAGTLLVFGVLISKHYELDARTVSGLANQGKNALTILGNRIGILDTCGSDEQFMAFSLTVYVCNNSESELVYDEIYTTYPASGGGRESAYLFLNDGDRERADEMLRDIYFIERYEPVTLPAPLTWTEDPFEERYWRFIFYSLRPTRHLLAAARETRNEQYYEKTREIIESFLDVGMDQPHAWDDDHGIAFRTMVLVNTWWKLREAGELPNQLSDKILAALEEHGDYLLDPEHYEPSNNHAVTQATALLVLAHSFPDLANAPVWRQTAIERIDTGLQEIIDEDGVLIENSPYYHFYVLEKYWEIRKYAEAEDILISDVFTETIDKMIGFATYVLTPEQQPPLLGASIPREISRSGEFREIAERYPEFDYVMTAGKAGDVPENQHQFYPSSGIALLRSGWGEERPYGNELHVLFDTGPYRTDHSDRDVLTFMAYAEGAPIIRDAGLFTYEESHPFFNYFYGTNGHNTIMVDGQDQTTGTGNVESVVFEEEYGYVTAQHELYSGVVHNRALMTIEEGAVLIIDHLASSEPHQYEQLFHTSEHSELTNETERIVEGHVDDIPFSIEQFGGETELMTWRGDTDAIRGFCAIAYEELVPCPELSFVTNGTNAQFVTLIRMGEAGTAYTASYEDGAMSIDTGESVYEIEIAFPDSGALGSSYITLSVDQESRGNRGNSMIERIKRFFNELF